MALYEDLVLGWSKSSLMQLDLLAKWILLVSLTLLQCSCRCKSSIIKLSTFYKLLQVCLG